MNKTLDLCLTRSKNSSHELKFWTELTSLMALNLLVMVGNIFVLLALIVDRQLRNPTHYFICSLAVADLTLGIFVLPFASVFQMNGVWTFGPWSCRIWLMIDVWLCTASIYSLVAITLDRYIAVTKPLIYKSYMTHRKACILLASVWIISFIICLPAMIVSLDTCRCTQMGHSAVYIAYSSTGSFYFPMTVILYLYARIYATVRRIRMSGNNGVVLTGSQRRKKRPRIIREHVSLLDKGRQLSAVLRVHKGSYHPARKISNRSKFPISNSQILQSRRASENVDLDDVEEDNNRLTTTTSKRLLTTSCPNSRRSSASSQILHDFILNIAAPAQLTTMWGQRIMTLQKCQKKFASELRALKTVGIVTGCFLLSWIGFCIVYTMQAFPGCRTSRTDNCVPDWLVNLTIWLGYANSAMNPIIYGISNQQFRKAFRRIAYCGLFKFCDAPVDY